MPLPHRKVRFPPSRVVDLSDIRRLRSFLAPDDFKLNPIALFQAFVALTDDGAVMHEHVGSIVASQKAVSFGTTEPL